MTVLHHYSLSLFFIKLTGEVAKRQDCVLANFISILLDQPSVETFTTGTPKNTVVQGTTVNVTCVANGYPAPTYTIKRENTVVSSTGGKFVITNIQLSEEDYTYSCEPNNTIGRGPIKQLKITVQGDY